MRNETEVEDQKPATGSARRRYRSLLVTRALFAWTLAFWALSPLLPFSASAQAADFSCAVDEHGSDAVLEFSGTDVGSSANLRDTNGWVATVTGQTEHRVISGAGEAYHLVLNSLGATVTCTASRSCETSAILELCDDGVLLGSTGDFKDASGLPIAKVDSLLESEALIGRQYDIFHDFLGSTQWSLIANNGFPYDPDVGTLLDEGRVLFLNWKNPGGPEEWAAIAGGSQDSVVNVTAAELAAYGKPVFLTFHHEPEDNIRDAAPGSIAQQQILVNDYSAAWRHIHSRFAAMGADNVIFVWDMQGNLAQYQWMYESGLYPGDDVVDWVAWNPYNWYRCHSRARWRTAEQVFAEFYDWLSEDSPSRPSADKPLMIGEFSTEEPDANAGTTQTKGDWYRAIPNDLATLFPRIKALVMFDTEGRFPDGTVQFCEWSIHSSADALQGWTELATNPRFNRFSVPEPTILHSAAAGILALAALLSRRRDPTK